MRLRTRTVVAVLLAAVTAVVPTACTGQQGFQGGTSGPNEVRLVQQPWEDLIVENKIVSKLLNRLGYRTQVWELSVPLGAHALANRQADAYLGNWWPSQRSVYQKYLDRDQIKVTNTLVTGSQYAPAVPKYVAERYGVRSLADLQAKSSLFSNEFLGIEPGTPGNDYIRNAINDNAYGLGDWRLVQSSTAAMLSEVQRRVQDREPVVFLGWRPHWMNVQWDLHYLDDPQRVWPGSGEIRVVQSEDLSSRKPNVARLLSQMHVDRATASDWIYQLSKKKVPAERIAAEWIRTHPGEVRSWLRGVTTVDGKPAPT